MDLCFIQIQKSIYAVEGWLVLALAYHGKASDAITSSFHQRDKRRRVHIFQTLVIGEYTCINNLDCVVYAAVAGLADAVQIESALHAAAP